MIEPSSRTFTVVMPTYNRACRLSAAIQSVLAQSWQDFELWVVDDGSTDHTPETIASFSDERLRYLRTESNAGVAVCRNLGIVNSSSQFVAFLDDDDEWEPEYLASARQALADPAVDFVWCAVREWHEETGLQNVVRRSPAGMDGHLLSWTIIGLGTSYGLSVRRDVVERVGPFDESLRCCSDFEWFIRFAQSGLRGTFLDTILVKVHVLAGPRLTRRSPQRTEAVQKVLQIHEPYLRATGPLWSWSQGILMDHAYATGQKNFGRRIVWNVLRSERIDPDVLVKFILYELPLPLSRLLKKLVDFVWPYLRTRRDKITLYRSV